MEINPQQSYTEYKVLLKNFQVVCADVFGVIEHNLDTTQNTIKRDIHDLGQKITKDWQHFFTSGEQFPIAYKPRRGRGGNTGYIRARGRKGREPRD